MGIKVICSDCKEVLEEGEEPASHTWCKKCGKKEFDEIRCYGCQYEGSRKGKSCYMFKDCDVCSTAR